MKSLIRVYEDDENMKKFNLIKNKKKKAKEKTLKNQIKHPLTNNYLQEPF